MDGKGNLTIDRIDTIQAFFVRAIRDNKGDPTSMRRDILAILDHYSSTPENPRHGYCPTGPTSRCTYNRDKATGKSEHVPTLNPFSDAMNELLRPLFERLADPAALEACKMCYTQNPEESLHHLIWSLAPKEQFTSSFENELALCLGVCLFNDGCRATMVSAHKLLGLDASQSSLRAWDKIDHVRVTSADYFELPQRKERRKTLKRERGRKIEAFKKAEGPLYKSNSFY